jgi:hypothetical protein
MSTNYGELTCELRLGLRGVITKPVVGDEGKYQSARIREEPCNLQTIIAIVCRLSTEIKY